MPSARRKPAPSPDVFERVRVRSSYERMSGYAPFFYAWLADLPRLCSGASCWALVMCIASESLGRPRDKGEPMPEWTLDLDKDWLATMCRTDRRTVDRDLKYLESSGMAQLRYTIKGMVAARLCFRDWPNLPDYTPPTRPDGGQPAPGVPQEVMEFVRDPRRVKAGASSEPVKITCPVSSLRFEAKGSVDLAFTAMVKGGELLVTSQQLAESEQKANNGKRQQKAGAETSQSSVFSKLASQTRRGGLEKGEGTAKTYRKKSEHPRADELAHLFDPILLRSCQRSLSADTVAFNQSLDALGDLPHDFLVKFVIQRAERPISSPKVCASILKEARANWEKVKNLPDAQRIPPQSSKGPKSFAESVVAEASRRIAKYGRVI